jgi:hypothetical protein
MSRANAEEWVRWAFVLPAAAAAYFGTGWVLGSMAQGHDPDSAHPNPSFKLSVLATFLQPYAYVLAGVYTAPHRRLSVAILLSILLTGMLIWWLVNSLERSGFAWSPVISLGIQVVMLVGACIQVHRGNLW